MPKTVSVPAINGTITYTYNAAGQKTKADYKWHSGRSLDPVENSTPSNFDNTNSTKTTEYISNRVYENGTLKFVILPNGYIQNGNYYFYLRDHLGNNSVVCDANGNVVQNTYYHPYGKPITDESFGQAQQPFRFGGKEEEKMFGLNSLDFVTRRLNEYGIFDTQDLHAENYYSMSPYMAMGGNPLRNIDPTGMDWFQNNITGDVYYNSSYTKDDLSRIEGDGWSWFGANDIFMQNKNDYSQRGWTLATHNGGQFSIQTNNPLTSKDDELVLTLYLTGKNAVSFMNDRGYSKAPLDADFRYTETNYNYAEGNGVISQTLSDEYTTNVHSWTYTQKENVKNADYKVTKLYSKEREFKPFTNSWTETREERRLYDYNKKQRGDYSGVMKVIADFMTIFFESRK